jgi:beta-lactamase regulating signal transducer with metallopeptidase domain
MTSGMVPIYVALSTIGRSLPSITTLVLIMCAIAIGVARLCGSRRAATRSVIWQAALLACIALPVAALVGPAMRVRVRVSDLTGRGVRIAQGALAGVADEATPPTTSTPERRAIALGWIWLGGFALLSFRLAGQLAAADRVRRRATRIHDAAAAGALARAREAIGCARDVPILLSLDVDVPLALGVMRPAIIVPASSSEWSADEWYLVLLHEVAHVTRRDLLMRSIGMAASMMHWFNPLVLWTRNGLERDAELAADDVVLRAGVASSRYAEVLLAMAERARWHPAPEPALTFSRPSGLELRLAQILGAAPSGPVMNRSAERSVAATSVATAAILGCLRLSVYSSMLGFVPASGALVRHEAPAAVIERSAERTTVEVTKPRIGADWRVAARVALVELLNDPSPQVRAAAAHSLDQLSNARDRAGFKP